MSHCSRTVRLVSLILACAAALTSARAADPDAAPRPKLVQKVYSVADLIVPIPDYPAAPAPAAVGAPKSGPPAEPAVETKQDVLIKMITNCVAPQSWAERGGMGTIDYMPIGMSLVVNQPQEIQGQVADLLAALRRLQDVQVAVEVRAVTVSDAIFEESLLKNFDIFAAKGPAFLTEQQTKSLLECAQGDRNTTVVQAPKVTTFSGQEASISSNNDQFFVTNVKCQFVNGHAVYVPQNEPYSTGFQMTVRPTVTPDRKTVLLMLDAELRELADDKTDLFPVMTSFITPQVEASCQGRPVPFTQFIQQPTLITRGLTKVLGIPDGRTAVLYAGRATRIVHGTESVPILGDLPFLGELFQTPTKYTASDHLLFLVTPRVLVTEAPEKTEAVKAAPAPCHPTASDAPCCAGCPRACPVAAAPMPAPVVAPCTSVMPAAVWCPAAAPMPACCPNAAPMPAPPAEGVQPATQVQIDACILSVDPAYFDRPDGAVWADLSPKACAGQPKFLGAGEAQRFCQAVRAQSGGKCLSEPKIMTLSGQMATFVIGGEQMFVRGIEFVDGKAEPVFKMEATPVGAQMVMLPTVSADGRFVRLAVKTRISTAAPTQPAGYRVTIAAEDDPDGESARTETVRRPAVNVQQSDATVSFPVGRTLLLHLGASSPDEHPLIVMLTPTVIATPPVACPPPPVPCPAFAAQPAPVVEEQAAPPADTKLAKLLAKYRQACSAGDAAKARKLADRCLAIDPTCFGK